MCMPVKLGVRMYATYVNYLTLGGGALLPPIGVGNWCRRWGKQLATSGGEESTSAHVNIPKRKLDRKIMLRELH